VSALQLYEQWFEELCLLETGNFYRQEARKLLDEYEYNCSEYMEKVRLVSPTRCPPLCVTVQLVMFQRIHFETVWSHRADDAAHLLSSHFLLTICGLLLDSH